MKKLLAILLAVAMVFAFAACGNTETPSTSEGTNNSAEGNAEGEDNSLNEVMEKGTLVLGLDDSFPPMGFQDESGEIVGFDIDMAKELASRMGVELVLQPVNWDTKNAELNNKTIDVLWNGFSITEERKQEVLFSDPYMINHQIIIVLKDSGIQSKEDLAGKVVCAQIDSSAADAISKEADLKASFGDYIEVSDYVSGLTELKNGTVDCVVVDECVGRYYIEKEIEQGNDVYQVLEDNFGQEDYAIGFRLTDQALRDEVNKVLGEMIEDGTAAEISNTWFGRDVTKGE